MSGDPCGLGKSSGSRKKRSRKVRRAKKRKITKKIVKTKELEYCIMIKRAIYRTQNVHGTTTDKVIQYIKKRFSTNEKVVSCCVRKYVPKMIKYGFIYRNKTNPLQLKVTLKGKNMRSLLLKRYKKKVQKRQKRARRVVRRRTHKRTAKRRKATKKKKSLC